MKFDVIVSGAGAAGFGAAMGAARLGKKVLLLDTNGAPGGTTVFGGCPVLTANAPFDKMEPKGIFREFMEALGERCHIAEGNITCNTSEMDISLLMTRFLKAAGVTMLFYATLIEAQTVSDRIRNITVFCCGKKHTFEADYFVDATGDAVLADLAGCPTVTPDDLESMTKTLLFRVNGVTEFDKPKLKKLFSQLDFPYPWQDNFMGTTVGSDGKDILINLSAVSGSALDPFDRTRMDMQLREQVDVIFRWMREKLPGFENCRLSAVAPAIGVRSSRNILSRRQFTCQDLNGDTPIHDGIAYAKCFYGDHFVRSFKSPWGNFQTGLRPIPYGALQAQNISNLLAAGRCIGIEPKAVTAIRLAPCCMTTGQVSGIACAMGIPEYKVLKQELLKQNIL